MDLKQARRFYKTYKRHPNNTLDIKTFLTICETYEYYLKEVRNLVSDRDKQIEKLKKDLEFYKEIALKGGQ